MNCEKRATNVCFVAHPLGAKGVKNATRRKKRATTADHAMSVASMESATSAKRSTNAAYVDDAQSAHRRAR